MARRRTKLPASAVTSAESAPPTAPGAYAEEYFPHVEERTLLRSCCGEYPKRGQDSEHLAKIARDRPELYATMLGLLMRGASLRSASRLIGITLYTVRNWISRGIDDTTNARDTFYSRFCADVQRAIAHAVVTAECAVSAENPLAYLERGQARELLADSQLWARGSTSDSLATVDSDLQPLVEYVNPSTEGEDTTTEDSLTQALAILDSHKLLTSPAFLKHAKRQAGHPEPAECEAGEATQTAEAG